MRILLYDKGFDCEQAFQSHQASDKILQCYKISF